jgi:hypothetical protein
MVKALPERADHCKFLDRYDANAGGGCTCISRLAD